MTIGWNFARVGVFAVLIYSPALAAPIPDRLTPADADMVITVNVRQMLRTPVIQKHALDPLQTLLKRNAELRQFFTAAGLDPLKDIHTIGLSTSGNPAGTGKLLAVVRGAFEPDKAKTAAEEYAKKHPGHIKALKEGELPMWEITSDNKSFFAAFAGKSALVMTASKEDTLAAVRRANKPPQPLNKELQAALDHLPDGESAWLAMVATEQVKQLLQSDDTAKDFADALQSVTGTLKLTEDALLTLVVHNSNAAAAAQVKSKLDDLLKVFAFVGAGRDGSGQLIKDVLDSIKLATDKNDVSIRVKLTGAQLEKARQKGQ